MIKKYIVAIAMLLAIGWPLLGQEAEVLITIGGDMKITQDEYVWMYERNSEGAAANLETPETYLEPYIDFKLKVKDAEELGMESGKAFKNELEEHKNLLLQSYLFPQFTEEDLVNEAYERMQVDVYASHILLRLPEDASPEDNQEAYNKLLDIRKQILAGSSFEAMARTYSDDRSAQVNGGRLNYFTVFSMDYPFETVAYNLPVGEISMPVRTSYGYQLVKVNERRSALGKVRIAHIFVRSTEDMSPGERVDAETRIREAYDSLSKGKSFTSQAVAFSEDPRTANSGGELPVMGVGQMDPAFEKVVFEIERTGDFSTPFMSTHGWHIVKLLEKRGVGSFDEMKPILTARVDRLQRLKYHQDQYFEHLKSLYGFEEFISALDIVYNKVDNSLLTGTWDGADLQSNPTPLLEIGESTLSVGDFVQYVVKKQNPGRRARQPKFYIEELYEQYRIVSCHQIEKSLVPEKYPEYNFQLQEYHDGLLLFEILDQKVWSKALTDTVGLRSYFESHRKDYMWNQRSDAIIVTCADSVDIMTLRKKYKKILSGSYNEDRLNEKYCKSELAKCISVAHVLTESGVYPRVDAQKGVAGPGSVYTNSNTKGFVIIKELRPPEPKQLSEAQGQVVSDYQKYLEEQWMKDLRQKYPVQVNRELLKQ